MSLCLTILSYHKITPGQCAEKFLNEGTIRIGRGPANDWVLPDPERLISSQHCVVQYRDGHYYLTDNSTNGVELVRAGLRMRRGSSERLVDGETFRIGDYEIQARIDSSFQLGTGDAGRGAGRLLPGGGVGSDHARHLHRPVDPGAGRPDQLPLAQRWRRQGFQRRQ